MTYEIPLGVLIWGMIQHEENGHGGRGREFDLDSVYGAGLGSAAYTDLNEDLESNEQIIVQGFILHEFFDPVINIRETQNTIIRIKINTCNGIRNREFCMLR